MRKLPVVFVIYLVLFMPLLSFGQQGRDNTGGEVLMLEEIRIEVAPELPTIVVTIPRQRPDISPVVLQKKPEDLITVNTTSIKPRLSDLVITKLEEPQKMLAKKRSQ